jgi:hypothetical protein
MTKFTAEQICKQLFDKVSSIKLNDAAAIFGTTSKESMLQSLRKGVAELGAALAGGKSYDEIMELYETMASAIDTAGVTGLISEAEMTGYYKLVDDLWAAIEKENK